jgi:hypothetical protein
VIAGLGAAEAATIDGFINKVCQNPAHFGELEQLRLLFTWRFRRGLERLLNGTLHRQGRAAVCDVQIGWIDKIPVAMSPSALTRRTELGDAILLAFHDRRDFQGSLISSSARAALLQAKIATLSTQLAAPTVPVGRSKSTRNELALLSRWPVFDLYATGRSKTKLLQATSVRQTSCPSPHAWFIAAPGKPPHTSFAWPCWWMAGEADAGAPCTSTLGELIVAFLNPNASGAQVGVPFIRQVTGPPAALPTASDWSDLCNEISRIVKRYPAPPTYFIRGNRVYGPPFPRSYSIPCWATSFLRASASGRKTVHERATGLSPNLSPRYGTEPFRPVRWGGPIAPRGGRGMFLLAVTITSISEG